MKSKVFRFDYDKSASFEAFVEQMLNEWLLENPRIRVISFSQSMSPPYHFGSPGVGGGILIMTIFYELDRIK